MGRKEKKLSPIFELSLEKLCDEKQKQNADDEATGRTHN
jgi:hypothetical protein